MALPSSCPPPEFFLEHSFFESVEDPPERKVLPLKLNGLDIFFSMMNEWYKRMVSARRTVNKKDIIKRAQFECQKMSASYSLLPSTWLRTLHEKYNVDFVWKPVSQAKQKTAMKALVRACADRKLNIEEMQNQMKLLKEKKISPDSLILELEGLREIKSSTNNYALVDLSNEPPPPFWVQAISEGRFLPRTLRVVSVKEKQQIIVFYDYSETQAVLPGWTQHHRLSTLALSGQKTLSTVKKIAFPGNI